MGTAGTPSSRTCSSCRRAGSTRRARRTGKHTLWAYCHVPNGSTVDMRERIEAQIERFAPGFRDCIDARSVMFPADMERRNANLVGGDIGGGAGDFAQFFARPVLSLNPYKTAIDGVYLCSSSTPPGVGVHGMCGYYAARAPCVRRCAESSSRASEGLQLRTLFTSSPGLPLRNAIRTIR